MRKALYAFAVVVAAGLTLAGCSSGLTLSPDQTNIQSCTKRSPVEVTSISAHKSYSCDYHNVEFVFPDGTKHRAPEIGGVSDWGSTSGKVRTPVYELSNLGTLGVVADRMSVDGKHTQWWGTQEGLSQTWAAYGKQGNSLGR